MFELVATGSQPGQRFRHRVRPEQVCTIGRGPDCDFVTAWDNQISRRHVEIHSNDQCLRLQRLKSAQNGVFVDGEEVDSRKLRLGDSFVIGHTTFAVTSSNVGSTDQTEPLEAVVFNSQDLQDVRLGDADRRIDVLAKLPTSLDPAHKVWGLVDVG